MSYYLGFLKNKKDTDSAVVFKSMVRPDRDSYKYFVHVVGPFDTEKGARIELSVLKRRYGVKENPIKGLVTKDGIRKAIALSRKVKKLYGQIRKNNPGKSYHDRKFLQYMKELEKYVIGSAPYIAVLAKAYDQLESAKDS